MINKKTFIYLIIFGIWISLILLMKYSFFRETVYTIIISSVIAYTLNPITIIIDRKINNWKLSSIFIIILLIIINIIFLASIFPQLIKESGNISSTLSSLNIRINKIMGNIKIVNNDFFIQIRDNLNSKLQKTSSLVMSDVITKFFNSGEKFIELLIIPIITYYLLCDKVNIKKLIIRIFPTEKRTFVKDLFTKINEALTRYILSQFILSFIVSLFTFIILIIFKIKMPLLLSLLNGILNIIPYFGPILGTVAPVALALLISPKTALYIFLCLYTIQFIEGNIISPLVISKSVEIHPLSVILLLVVGEKLGGFWGMVFAVPLGVIIKIFCEVLDYYIY